MKDFLKIIFISTRFKRYLTYLSCSLRIDFSLGIRRDTQFLSLCLSLSLYCRAKLSFQRCQALENLRIFPLAGFTLLPVALSLELQMSLPRCCTPSKRSCSEISMGNVPWVFPVISSPAGLPPPFFHMAELRKIDEVELELVFIKCY